MKKLNITMILAGLACVPATFHQTRKGSFILSLVFICVLVSIAFFINHRLKIQGYIKYPSFVLGALVSEIVLSVYWGMMYGYDDGYGFSFSLQIFIMEFLAISLVGCMAIAILNLLKKLIIKQSNRSLHSG
jgi:hypothetical protein